MAEDVIKLIFCYLHGCRHKDMWIPESAYHWIGNGGHFIYPEIVFLFFPPTYPIKQNEIFFVVRNINAIFYNNAMKVFPFPYVM